MIEEGKNEKVRVFFDLSAKFWKYKNSWDERNQSVHVNVGGVHTVYYIVIVVK